MLDGHALACVIPAREPVQIDALGGCEADDRSSVFGSFSFLRFAPAAPCSRAFGGEHRGSVDTSCLLGVSEALAAVLTETQQAAGDGVLDVEVGVNCPCPDANGLQGTAVPFQAAL